MVFFTYERSEGFVQKPWTVLVHHGAANNQFIYSSGLGGASIPNKKLCARLAKVPTTRKNVFEDANLGVVVETACRQIPDDVHQFDLTD